MTDKSATHGRLPRKRRIGPGRSNRPLYGALAHGRKPVNSIGPRDLLGVIPVVAALAGPAIYAFVAYGYDSFYWRLGTTPADVGLGYGEILTSAVPAIVLVIALAVGAAVLAVLGAAVLGWLLRRRLGLRWNKRKRLGWLVRFHRRTLLMLAIAGGLSVLLSVGIGVGRDAKAAVRNLRCGQRAESIRVLRFTLVHLEPPKVRMVWVASSPPPSGLPLGVPLWELGHTETQVVLYEDETVGGKGNVGLVIVPFSSVGLITSNLTSRAALPRSCL